MNVQVIMQEKRCIEDLLKLHEIEEKVLRQLEKIDWIRLGDGNNSYFHASLKSKQHYSNMSKLHKEDGTVLNTQEDIEREVFDFYGKIMGMDEPTLDGVDIVSMRRGNGLNMGKMTMLIRPVSDNEIEYALKSIRDLKAPGVDGFGSKFFKSSWGIIKHDVLNVVKSFFRRGTMDIKFNNTLETLTPKSNQAKTIREFRPICYCTTVYKII